MEKARATWTNERLDDLAGYMNAGFERIDRRFERMEARMDRLAGRIERVEMRIDSLQHAMLHGAIAILATQFVGFAGLIALHFS